MKDKTADELFEELGLICDEDEDRIAIYKITQMENKIYKCVFHKKADKKFRLKIYEQYCEIELLKAINKKCEELEWL